MRTTRPMHLGGVTLAAAAVLTLGVAVPAQAAPSIPLNHGQEAPAPTVTGAHGWFSYELDGTEFCYTLAASGLSAPAVAAHVHVAPRNVPGPVVIPLTVGAGTTFEVSDCVDITGDLATAIAENPKAYYINVHTPLNPPGEIRGQLK